MNYTEAYSVKLHALIASQWHFVLIRSIRGSNPKPDLFRTKMQKRLLLDHLDGSDPKFRSQWI